MSRLSRPLVGSIVERSPASSSPLPPSVPVASKAGFPAVQHRSQSAFARARKADKNQGSRSDAVPNINNARESAPRHDELQRPIPIVSAASGPSSAEQTEDWRKQMHEDNQRLVENMTDEERDRERREIIETFGADIGDLLARAKSAREATQSKAAGPAVIDGEHSRLPEVREQGSEDAVLERLKRPRVSKLDIAEPLALRLRDIQPRRERDPPPSPKPILSTSNSRPPSRADQKIRFAEVTPASVHYYQSAPSSPKKKPLALLPPSDAPGERVDVVSLGEFKGKLSSEELNKTVVDPKGEGEPPSADVGADATPEVEEGTPEYIRRKFFPHVPPNDPSLAWIQESAPSSSTSAPSLRFDLTGTPIPATVSATLPTHLGLHHHAEGAQAGYTLDDLFLLARSSVPAQRAVMLDVLARIASKLRRQGIKELNGQEDALRRRLVAAGLEAMSERGSVGMRAVDLVWLCVAGWNAGADSDPPDAFEAHLTEDDGKTLSFVESLPIPDILAQIVSLFAVPTLPHESLSRLLGVVHALARATNVAAEQVVQTPHLVARLAQTFLLTPLHPDPDDRARKQPESAALYLLQTLALASRENAHALVEPSNALLRFVALLPSDSPIPVTLAETLLAETLRFFSVLGSYGLASHLASTAHAHFARVAEYILSEECRSRRLMCAWLNLVEVWTVCATDPHRTTPEHDVLWSQVVAWGWEDRVLELRSRLSDNPQDFGVWSGVWRALSAFLEGARVNGVKGGEKERKGMVENVKSGFDGGLESAVIASAVDRLRQPLRDLEHAQDSDVKHLLISASPYAHALASVIRLWLACVPPQAHSSPGPPFHLPFARLSELCANLATHPLWSALSFSSSRALARPLTLLLSVYLRLSRALPDTPQDLWMAQAFAVVTRLQPGDEDAALFIVSELLALLNPGLGARVGWGPREVWERGATFLGQIFNAAVSSGEGLIGALWATPRSISLVTTFRVSSTDAAKSAKGELKRVGLPLGRDWTLVPLELITSTGSDSASGPETAGEGEAEITSDEGMSTATVASELDVVKASLLLTNVGMEVLQRFSLHSLVLTREEAVLGCMKVFMLEHGRARTASSQEVFRDADVSALMNDLVTPFTIASSSSGGKGGTHDAGDNLETAAVRFLGPGTPFFQYYTDFVALYDALSFAHPLFARLLLPPVSMEYAPDYRTLLWNDYEHILRGIRCPVEQVISSDIREYLWPVDRNTQMVSSYMRALIHGQVEGFLKVVAVHHLACNIWPDLQDEEGGRRREGAQTLLRAVVRHGGADMVKDVVAYRQRRPNEGPALLPPECFEAERERKMGRSAWVAQWASDDMRDRISPLLNF